jgi:hypothetical protein
MPQLRDPWPVVAFLVDLGWTFEVRSTPNRLGFPGAHLGARSFDAALTPPDAGVDRTGRISVSGAASATEALHNLLEHHLVPRP